MPSPKQHKRDASGGVIHTTLQDVDASRDALMCMRAIEVYSGFSEDVLKRLEAENGFPMKLIAKKWISSKRRIDEWVYNLLGESRGEAV